MELGISSLQMKGYVLHSVYGVTSMTMAAALSTPCEWAMTRSQIRPHCRANGAPPGALVGLTVARNLLHFTVKVFVDVRLSSKLYITPNSKGLAGTLVGTAVAYPLETLRVARIAGLSLPLHARFAGLRLALAHAALVHVISRVVALHMEVHWLPDNLVGTRFGTSLCQTAGLIVGSVAFHMLDTLRKFAFAHYLVSQQPVSYSALIDAAAPTAGDIPDAHSSADRTPSTGGAGPAGAAGTAGGSRGSSSSNVNSLWSGVVWVVPSAACQVLLPHLFMHAFRSAFGMD